jgi:hypothetical protein
MSGTGPERPGPGGISDELRPYVDRSEAEGIDRVGERLEAARPIPRAAFRAELRARLGRLGTAEPRWRPRHLGRLVAAYVGSGLLLLAVAGIGLAGVGPLG